MRAKADTAINPNAQKRGFALFCVLVMANVLAVLPYIAASYVTLATRISSSTPGIVHDHLKERGKNFMSVADAKRGETFAGSPLNLCQITFQSYQS